MFTGSHGTEARKICVAWTALDHIWTRDKKNAQRFQADFQGKPEQHQIKIGKQPTKSTTQTFCTDGFSRDVFNRIFGILSKEKNYWE